MKDALETLYYGHHDRWRNQGNSRARIVFLAFSNAADRFGLAQLPKVPKKNKLPKHKPRRYSAAAARPSPTTLAKPLQLDYFAIPQGSDKQKRPYILTSYKFTDRNFAASPCGQDSFIDFVVLYRFVSPIWSKRDKKIWSFIKLSNVEFQSVVAQFWK